MHHMPETSRPRLAIHQGETPSISGDGESLSMFIVPVNHPEIAARIGPEAVISHPGARITRTRGTAFPWARGVRVTGERYLIQEGNRIVAGMNVTSKTGKPAVISNVFVAPDRRRRGLATELLAAAKAEHPTLVVDSAMTEAGSVFFGYAKSSPAMRSERASRALQAIPEMMPTQTTRPR